MGVFYLSKRRAVYFGHKSIVHACDASEWVGMHSVCIKRHWPPLARPKLHFHSRNSLPLPHQSFPLFRRVDLGISTNMYSATAGTVQCIFNCKSVQTAVEIIIKISWILFIIKATRFFTLALNLYWKRIFTTNFILKLIIKQLFSLKRVKLKLGNVTIHYYFVSAFSICLFRIKNLIFMKVPSFRWIAACLVVILPFNLTRRAQPTFDTNTWWIAIWNEYRADVFSMTIYHTWKHVGGDIGRCPVNSRRRGGNFLFLPSRGRRRLREGNQGQECVPFNKDRYFCEMYASRRRWIMGIITPCHRRSGTRERE